MIINITYQTAIEDIQRKLNEIFRFLKIEFCKHQQFPGEKISENRWYGKDAKLLEITDQSHPTWIALYPWYTVRYLTELFKTKLGFHAQIFRRENDQWIQIVSDDSHTLQEQNEIGRDMSSRARTLRPI
jgi:hypothetical protein